MRLHRFFLTSNISKGKINSFSSPSLTHQLSHVFRLHAGDTVVFFDGTGTDYTCEIVSLEKADVMFRVVETSTVKPLSETKLALAVSLIKKDNFEWIIQKGTELGVSEFIPLISERSEKKGFNMERANKIMTEALEQSGRSDMAVVREPIALADFLESEKRPITTLHLSGESFKNELAIAGEIVLCIGPEGGWSDKEIGMFKEKGASVIKLNSPVLRAETAAVAAATLFLVR
ncbi:MAG TPA: RsmE family RNA methyltransferase [Candidatus Paceibacterota bacterium]